MRRIRDHAALAVSLAALVVALGGTAVASGYVITSSGQIKDGVVAGADVTNSSLTGADVKNHSLTPSDFRGSVAGPKGDQGPQGPVGPKGETGASILPDVYTGYSASGSLPSNANPNNVVAMALTIDGYYVIQANLILTNTANTATFVDCRLSTGYAEIDFASTTLDAAGGLDTQTVTLSGAGPSGTAAILYCSGPADYADADVIATRVRTVH